jgi:membrane protein YqaA with SNARE-associated domain
MPGEATALWGLALSAFTSATLLPGTSEVVLAALHATRAADPLLLLLVASTANVAGSCVNWLMGMFAARFRDRRWFPASPAQLARAEAWYARYGLWSLLLSWVPVIGDPLTVIAGILRVPFFTFLALVALAKTGRYAFVLYLAGFV